MFPIKRSTILLILGMAGFTVMADNWVVSPILPAISRSIGVPVTSAGLLIVAYLIPFGLFQLVFGPLADRYGKRQILNLAMLLFTLGAALTAIGYSLKALVVYRALTGAFAASVMPISLALIADLVPMEERQSAVGAFLGIAFLGQGLSMAIGGVVSFYLNWHGVFAIYSCLAALVTILIFTIGRGIPSTKNPHSEWLAPYGRLIGNAVSLTLYLAILAEGFLIVGSFSYLGSFIANVYHYNNLYIGLIMTAFGAASVIAGRVSGALANRIGRKTVLVLGLLSATVADALLFFSGDLLAALIIAVFLLGLGFMLAHSTLTTIATSFAARAQGAAMSLVAFCFMGGGGVGTAVGGNLLKAHGFQALYTYYGAALLILVVLAGLLVKTETGSATSPQGSGGQPR
jgi:predicted MFS family arabinose efflux permease